MTNENFLDVFNDVVKVYSPSTITILPTYRCTAACTECCFESSPQVKGKLSKTELYGVVDKVIKEFPDLRLIVFSGGECFTLGNVLFDVLKYIKTSSNNMIQTRCVTNGYWGSTERKAKKTVEKLIDSGLNELNLSTGLDHQGWVPLNSVMNAAIMARRKDILTLVTIEADTPDSKCLQEFLEHDHFSELSKDQDDGFIYQCNSWMPFHDDSASRGQDIEVKDLYKGCDQILENMVITPHGRISACCGLTFEYIPEMILGDISAVSYKKLYREQLDDLLKLWIKTNGPLSILETVYGNDPDISSEIDGIKHICHACVLLHNHDRKKGKLADYLSDSIVVSTILNKINIVSEVKAIQNKNHVVSFL